MAVTSTSSRSHRGHAKQARSRRLELAQGLLILGALIVLAILARLPSA